MTQDDNPASIDVFALIDEADEPTEEILSEDEETEEITIEQSVPEIIKTPEPEFKFRPNFSEDPKQMLINQIFAAGVNSFNRGYTPEEQSVMQSFLKLEFDLIAPTWNHLSPEVQFKLFSAYVTEFKDFMLSKKGKSKDGI